MRTVTDLAKPYGDPTDLDGQAARAAERDRKVMVAELMGHKDLIRLVTEDWGRRHLRRVLAGAKLHVWSDDVASQFSRHHGEMCANEILRTQALQILWPILRLLAAGAVPPDAFVKLMTETDA